MNESLPVVLFVDDDELFLKSLKRSLRRCLTGFYAKSGYEAIETLKGNSSIRIIVSDMNMPGMSGSELLDYCAQNYPELRRIVLSGNIDLLTRDQFRPESEPHCLLSKPCHLDDIIGAITTASIE